MPIYHQLGRIPSKRHVAFEVTSAELEGMRNKLVRSRTPIEEARPIEGIRRFFARDPAGNRLEFYART